MDFTHKSYSLKNKGKRLPSVSSLKSALSSEIRLQNKDNKKIWKTKHGRNLSSPAILNSLPTRQRVITPQVQTIVPHVAYRVEPRQEWLLR